MKRFSIFNLALATALSAVCLLSCNKGLDLIEGNPPISPNTVSPLRTISDSINTIPTDSLYYAIMLKGGGVATLSNRNATFTAFVPTNAAVRLFITAFTGGAVPAAAPDVAFKNFINSNSFPATLAGGIVNFNIIPQRLVSSSFPTVYPSAAFPTLINPAPALSAFLRFTTFPTNRNGFYLNSIPISELDKLAANGVFHETSELQLPPLDTVRLSPTYLRPSTVFLWNRILHDSLPTNPNALRYLKAAILRADSGVAVTSPSSLQGALQNIGANLTLYAPTDLAFQQTLTGLFIQGGLPPATAAFLASSPNVFSNPLLFGTLTAQTVKGIIVYHIMTVRAFNNNLPTTQTLYPTLLNSAFPTHPGIGLSSTFSGQTVTATTVKGLGNATAANVLINRTISPDGSSDQFYANGVLHKINQVLRPQ